MIPLKDPRIKKCSEYHYQIKGSLCTVNFYPTKGTFYVNGATNKAPIKYDNIQFLIDIADGKKELIVATDKTERKQFKPSKRRALTKKSATKKEKIIFQKWKKYIFNLCQKIF